MKLKRLRKSSGLTSKMDKCLAVRSIVHFNFHFNSPFYFLYLNR